MASNDNDIQRDETIGLPVDPHGRAALVLVESLIHGLIARSILTTRESWEIVTSAIDVQADQADQAGAAAGPVLRSKALLSSIAASLDTDL